ncbi:Glycosyltransferase [Vibrio vulnificus]|uniref:glycosyltransferase n=2 Tax=Vibrio vulnificus TaxID=672 RepID=UPI0015E851D6|nr:glycosyltransferase [Vibrio vulnificus]
MILITNKVKTCDNLKDQRLSQAGLNYQAKLSEFLNPELELSLVPVFLDYDYDNEEGSKHVFVNTIPRKGRFFRSLRYITDSFKLFFLACSSKEKSVLIYNLDIHNLLFVFLNVYFSSKKNYIVVADYIVHKRHFTKVIFDFIYKKVDGVIVLNDRICINENTQLLAGLVRSGDVVQSKKFVSINDAIFSGSLGKTTGFELCLEAFSKLPDIRLNITGKPYHYSENDFNFIISKFNSFENINFYGLIPMDEYKSLLEQSEIAFSLRDPADMEHDFNFPSKILEYLAAGKFVISSKMYSFIPEGILFYCDFNTDSLVKAVKKVQSLSIEEQEAYKIRVYKFIMDNFTESRLIDCLNRLENDQQVF